MDIIDSIDDASKYNSIIYINISGIANIWDTNNIIIKYNIWDMDAIKNISFISIYNIKFNIL